jgi:hypothetical protein
MRSDYAVVTARSPRVIVVLPDADVPNGARAEDDLDRVLEWFGRVWGGAFMICVPNRGGIVPVVFTRLAQAYDPDVVLPWQPTLGSIASADIDAARALVSHRAQLYSDVTLRTSHQLVGGRADTGQLQKEVVAFDLGPTQFPELVAQHLQQNFPRPLTSLAQLAQDGSVAGGRPMPPQSVADAAREALGRPVTDIDVSTLDPWQRRLLKGRLGIVGVSSPAAAAGLRGVDELVTTYTAEPSHGLAAAFVGLIGAYAGTDAPDWAAPDVLANTPVQRSKAGLQIWSYGRAIPRPFLLVVGDTVEDFCLYLGWQRVYGDGSAAWLPAHAAAAAPGDATILTEMEACTEIVREMTLDLPGHTHTYASGAITSFSLDLASLEPLKARLGAHHWHDDVPARFAAMPILSPDELPISAPPPTYPATGDVFDRDLPLLIHDDGTVGTVIRSPIPQLLVRRGTGALLGNWVTDVTVARCRLPARKRAVDAAELDVSLREAGMVRAGRTGTACIAVQQDDLPAGLATDHALTGLSLRDPDLGVLVGALLPEGWTWQLSDAGRFYQGFSDMAGGFSGLVDMLRDPAASAVLDGFLDIDKGNSKGKVVLTDKRRYLRMFECRELVRRATPAAGLITVADTRAVLDQLLGRKILTRGLVLKCSRCRFTAFQPLSSFDDGYTCPRCTFRQPLISASWCETPPHEPSWFYRLDELVFQALLKNVRVPALTLANLGAGSSNARHLWSIELLQDTKRMLELDFVCLSQGVLSAGEAKSNGKLSEREASAEVAKTVRGARLLTADQIVFATSSPRWAEPLANALNTQTSQLDRPTPLLLSGLT